MHGRGLGFGLYGDKGTKDCAKNPGQKGFERLDAEFLARWAFPTAFGDHFETTLPALRDAAPVLRAAAKALGLPKAKRLRVYDPYFCEGAVVGLLRGLGFKRVYNRNEDFYAVAAGRRLPAFDALLTNPPFSADHKVRMCGALGSVQGED